MQEDRSIKAGGKEYGSIIPTLARLELHCGVKMDSLWRSGTSIYSKPSRDDQESGEARKKAERGPATIFGTLMGFAHHILHGGKHVQAGDKDQSGHFHDFAPPSKREVCKSSGADDRQEKRGGNEQPLGPPYALIPEVGDRSEAFQPIPYSFNFLWSVLRFMPSLRAVSLLLPPLFSSVARMASFSIASSGRLAATGEGGDPNHFFRHNFQRQWWVGPSR